MLIHSIVKAIILVAGISIMGCSNRLPLKSYAFPEEFQRSDELVYKGHKVKEYQDFSNGKLNFRYFGYKNANNKIVKHGLYEGYDVNGVKRAEMLYSEGIPDGPFVLKNELNRIVASGIYKIGKRWEGTFLVPHFEDVKFEYKDGNNISMINRDNGNIYAEGTWKENKKWNGSFFNAENSTIEYYKDGKLDKTRALVDVIKEFD